MTFSKRTAAVLAALAALVLPAQAGAGTPAGTIAYHDKNFDKDKTVIYCGSGGRSALAGKVLKDMGYEKVYNVGGFKDWTGAVEK